MNGSDASTPRHDRVAFLAPGATTDPAALVLADVAPAEVSPGIGVDVLVCTVDSERHLLWRTADGEALLVPATCPHRPDGGPILATRGVVREAMILCLRHNNAYDLTTGECVIANGPGDPGTLHVRRGLLAGDGFITDMTIESEVTS